MNNHRAVILGFLCFAIVGLPCCFHEEPQTVTVYSYTCNEDGLGWYRSMSYAVYPQRQEVVSEYFSKYQACTIYDKNNWHCRFLDGSGWITVRGGSESYDWADEYARRKSVTVPVWRIAYWLSYVMEKNPPGASYCRTVLKLQKELFEKSKLPLEKP